MILSDSLWHPLVIIYLVISDFVLIYQESLIANKWCCKHQYWKDMHHYFLIDLTIRDWPHSIKKAQFTYLLPASILERMLNCFLIDSTFILNIGAQKNQISSQNRRPTWLHCCFSWSFILRGYKIYIRNISICASFDLADVEKPLYTVRRRNHTGNRCLDRFSIQ